MKVKATFRELSDCPLMSGWDYICEKYGINRWCMNEGLVSGDDELEISVEDAKYIGILGRED